MKVGGQRRSRQLGKQVRHGHGHTALPMDFTSTGLAAPLPGPEEEFTNAFSVVKSGSEVEQSKLVRSGVCNENQVTISMDLLLLGVQPFKIHKH